MTTLAVKDNIIAADGQVTAGDTISDYNCEKIVEINGCLVAGAGSWAQIIKFREWFLNHSDTLIVQQEGLNVSMNLPEELDGNFYGIVLYPSGELYLYEGRTDVSMPVKQPFSIGSGSVFAVGAMDAGAGAEEAVNIACYRDPYSGGEVQVMSLPEEQEIPSDDDLRNMSKEELLSLILGGDEDTTLNEGDVPNKDKSTLDKDTPLGGKDNLILVEDANGVEWELTWTDTGDDIIGMELESSENGLYSIDKEFLSECVDLDELKVLADLFEIPYAHNIKEERLASKIEEFCTLTIISSL